MNTSTKQLCGADVRNGTATLGAYNQTESALLGVNVVSAQHLRGIMFKECSGHLLLPDFRDTCSVRTRVGPASGILPPGCYASAFELDAATQCIMVVLMSPTEKGHVLDWNAAYMLPASVCKANLLQGIFQMVWSNGCWQSCMSSGQWQKHLQKADASVSHWLAEKGGSQVRAKQAHMQSSAAAAKLRLQSLFEGQIVLCSGKVAEVRGLEKRCGEDKVHVLPYTQVSMDSPSSSTWRLEHGTWLEETDRSSLSTVDWTWNSKSVTVTVHIL